MAIPIRKFNIHAVDRENDNTRKMVKPELRPTKSLVQRSALGEVGNKLQTLQLQQGVAKKTTVLLKKTTSVIMAKKPEPKKAEKPTQVKKLERAQTVPSEAYSTKQLDRVLDIDTSSDPLLVCEYIKDIFEYLQHLETKYKIEPNHLMNHNSTSKMRTVLVNWMVDVHINFELLLETLHLSIAILDRYLQVNKKVGRETLQLAGTAALYVAAKYEEIYIPDLSDFVYVCDNLFSKRDVLDMEQDILKRLDFELGRPSSLQFLRRYSQVGQVGPEHHALGKYLLELALLDYKLCHIAPSVQGAAALCLSVSVLNGLTDPGHAWSNSLEHYSTYPYSDIKMVVVKMGALLGAAETSKYQAIRVKYSSGKYDKISLHPKLKGMLVRKLTAQSLVLNRM